MPIVGQPLLVLGWTMVVNVRHNCEQPTVIQLVLKQSELGQTADLGICPGCGRGMHITQTTVDAAGALQFGIVVGEVQPHAPGN